MASATHRHTADVAVAALVRLAAAAIVPAAYTSVTFREPTGALRTRWASGESAGQLDALQYALGQGPCVEAVRSGSVCLAVFDGRDDPWPDFAAEAAACGVRSVLSTPIVTAGRVVAGLNVYAEGPEPFAEQARGLAAEIAQLIAAVLGLAGSASAAPALDALAARDEIAAAEGVLMAWQGGGRDGAFAALRRTAVRDRRPVLDVAREVLASPRPGLPPASP